MFDWVLSTPLEITYFYEQVKILECLMKWSFADIFRLDYGKQLHYKILWKRKKNLKHIFIYSSFQAFTSQ